MTRFAFVLTAFALLLGSVGCEKKITMPTASVSATAPGETQMMQLPKRTSPIGQ